jgi:hypothetical protein
MINRRPKKIPDPPEGLLAVSTSLWLPVWRLVRVQPSIEVKPWAGSKPYEPVQITASVKNVGLWAYTFADYDDGTRIFPGLEMLAPIAGYSERATGQALAAICRLGFMWRYVDGSKSGRPGNGQSSRASEYRLTVPEDIADRVPMLKFGIPEEDEGDHPNSDHLISVRVISDQVISDQVISDQVISDQVISDQVISATGSPELSDKITRTEFAPPSHDLVRHPDITGVPLATTSVEGARARLRPVENRDDDDAPRAPTRWRSPQETAAEQVAEARARREAADRDPAEAVVP